MKINQMLTLTALCLWGSVCYGQAKTALTSKGVFDNRQMNENFQFLVNSCDPAAEYHAEQNGENATDVVAGCLVVPGDATVWGANALAGYGENSSTTTNAVGIYASMKCLTTGSHCWGSNPLVHDAPSTSVASLIGEEIDISTYGAPKEAVGLQITGFLKGTVPPYGSAIWITPSIGSIHGWPMAINIGDGAAHTGVFLGTQELGEDKPSSTIVFDARDVSGIHRLSSIGSASDGSIQLSPARDVQITGHADLGFEGDAGQHLTTARANNDTVGEIRITNGDEAVYKFSSSWGPATPPVCTVTPTSDPSAVGPWWITYAFDTAKRVTELHVHIHKSGIIFFYYICIGNPR